MSKKVISILLSAAMLVAMLCVGVGSVTAAADDTYTYYFLAPDNFFKTEAGASNSSVGVYWWQPEALALTWPGVEMTAAPEVGENIFKIENVSPDTTTVIFNAFVDAGNPADPKLAAVAHQTTDINTEGYDADEAYEGCPECENFNGMIYVLNLNEKSINDFSKAETIGGAWFTLDDYKNNETYYGSYGFAADDKKGDTTPSDTTPATADEPTGAKGAAGTAYKAGEQEVVTIKFGNIEKGATIGAYNYEIYYDPEFVELALNDKGKPIKEDLAVNEDSAPTTVLNTDEPGLVKVAMMAAEGIENDVSGAPVDIFKLTFNVKKDASKLGIEGKCTSLTLIKNGEQVSVLGPTIDAADTFSVMDVPAGKEEPAPASSKPADTSSKTTDSSSKNESKKDTSSTTSKKSTNDNASSKSSSNANSAKGTTSNGTVATVQTAGTFAVVSLVVILMAAAAVVLYTRKKTEE